MSAEIQICYCQLTAPLLYRQVIEMLRSDHFNWSLWSERLEVIKTLRSDQSDHFSPFDHFRSDHFSAGRFTCNNHADCRRHLDVDLFQNTQHNEPSTAPIKHLLIYCWLSFRVSIHSSGPLFLFLSASNGRLFVDIVRGDSSGSGPVGSSSNTRHRRRPSVLVVGCWFRFRVSGNSSWEQTIPPSERI